MHSSPGTVPAGHRARLPVEYTRDPAGQLALRHAPATSTVAFAAAKHDCPAPNCAIASALHGQIEYPQRNAPSPTAAVPLRHVSPSTPAMPLHSRNSSPQHGRGSDSGAAAVDSVLE